MISCIINQKSETKGVSLYSKLTEFCVVMIWLFTQYLFNFSHPF